MDDTLCEKVPNRERIAQSRPATVRGVADNAVQAGDPNIAYVFALQAFGIAHSTVSKPIGEVFDRTQVAQVHAQAHDVNPGHGVLPLVVGPGAGRQRRGALRGLDGIGAQLFDGVERLGARSRGGDDDEVGMEGAGAQKLVNQVLNDAESDATADGLLQN